MFRVFVAIVIVAVAAEAQFPEGVVGAAQLPTEIHDAMHRPVTLPNDAATAATFVINDYRSEDALMYRLDETNRRLDDINKKLDDIIKRQDDMKEQLRGQNTHLINIFDAVKALYLAVSNFLSYMKHECVS